jgi:hypothetical protein
MRGLTMSFHQISAKRRVQVSQFGKGTFVNIREFYEANGKLLPGKKVRNSFYKSSPRNISPARSSSAT